MAQYLLPKLLNDKFHEALFHGSQAVVCVETERWHNFNTPPAGVQMCIEVTACTANICFPSFKMKLSTGYVGSHFSIPAHDMLV